jgi:DNA-directed RNA polymerase specialized sigma24 family protein
MTSKTPGSITRYLRAFQGGDPEAARKLWDRYFDRLVRLAHDKLRGSPRRAADEEDAALSAFDSFFRGAEQGRFRKLEDRDDLWQLLVLLTIRKSVDQVRLERRQKRGGQASSDGDADMQEILCREPSAELAAMMAEECQRLMGRLDDDELRTIALLRMEGFRDHEIADQLGCARRTVQRRVRLIQDIWQQEVA